MVRLLIPYISIWLILSSFSWSQPQEVSIQPEIDLYHSFENEPLNGFITITHHKESEIDINSFQMENKPLKVEFVKNVPLSANDPLTLSIYNFQIPGQPAGLYLLPAISVKVGDKVYTSIPTSYEVNKRTELSPEVKPGQQAEAAHVIIRLEVVTNFPSKIYPGQQGQLGYKIAFNGNVELTTEQLPLLDAEGFRKIGDKQVQELQEGEFNVQVITQQVRAKEAGSYPFPLSLIEGYAYKETASKQKNYLQPKLHAEVAPLTVTVLAFPEQGKPDYFKGALGPFQIKASLPNGNSVTVDDVLSLVIEISGSGDLDTVSLPSLTTLGFKQLFQVDDLPTVGDLEGNKKKFVVKLRPLSTAIKEIPAIPFAYFDPQSSHYVTLSTDALPITVLPRPISEQKVTPVVPPVKKEVGTTATLPAIEITEAYPLTSEDLRNLFGGTWRSLWIIPVGIGAVLLQIILQKHLKKLRMMPKKKRSEDLWKEASALSKDSTQFFTLLNQAFLLRLVERGIIPSENIPLDALPTEGIAGKVRGFLRQLDEQRFTGKMVRMEPGAFADAKQLFDEIGS